MLPLSTCAWNKTCENRKKGNSCSDSDGSHSKAPGSAGYYFGENPAVVTAATFLILLADTRIMIHNFSHISYSSVHYLRKGMLS
jgi:hypothetical protein